MESQSLVTFIPVWESWAWGASIQVGILAVAILAIEWVIPRSWPRIRYALWALVLIKALLPPTLGMPFGVGE
ncbi:MAG: hypothetical protein KC944_25390, partial [Candidatus Omnitrophica bacterium]|nr:hypothetical protein [Candidatus Omnitrophota bacterium]